jgi:hypothetical protein
VERWDIKFAARYVVVGHCARLPPAVPLRPVGAARTTTLVEPEATAARNRAEATLRALYTRLRLLPAHRLAHPAPEHRDMKLQRCLRLRVGASPLPVVGLGPTLAPPPPYPITSTTACTCCRARTDAGERVPLHIDQQLDGLTADRPMDALPALELTTIQGFVCRVWVV